MNVGIGLLAGSILAALGAGHPDMDLAGLLPQEISGWRARGGDEVYTAETLYTYIDGAAEVYRALNVRRVLARQYAKESEPDLIVDVFEMRSSQDAFGAYHHDLRTGPGAGFGQESELQGNAVAFWKGPYFVSVVSVGAFRGPGEALRELGGAIAGAIREEGDAPDLLRLLPAREGCAGPVRYFHDHSYLNTLYYLSDENLLNLSEGTEGILKTYGRIKGRPHSAGADGPVVLIVRYPSEEESRQAFDHFALRYMPDRDAEGAVRTEDGRYAGAACAGRLFLGVFEAPTREDALATLNHMQQASAASLPTPPREGTMP